MTQIQFIGTTPNELVELLDKRNEKRLEDFKKHLQNIKQPTKYMTRQEVAKMLSVDVSTIHNMSVRGVLQKYQISGRVLYKRQEVENAIVKLNK